MKRFPLRDAICLLLAVYLLADVSVLRGPLHRWVIALPPVIHQSPPDAVAQVAFETITLREMEETMRDYLWCRGEDWPGLSVEQEGATRQVVIERLVNGSLVRACRVKEGFHQDAQTAAADELAMFVKQFDKAGDFERRLALRQKKEKDLKNAMQDANDDQAWIDAKITERTQPVSDQDVSDWLKQNGASVAMPARYGVAHIYLTTHDAKKPDREAEMREIQRKLAAGEATFEALAAQYSEDERSKKDGGQLGWCARGRMPDDFMNAVEKLDAGEMSEPVETKLGWHVIRLLDKLPARASSPDEVRSEVSALLRHQRRDEALKALMTELHAQSAESIILNETLIETAEPAP